MIVPAIAVVPLESTVACVPPESVAVLFPVAVTSLPFMLYEVSAEVLYFLGGLDDVRSGRFRDIGSSIGCNIAFTIQFNGSFPTHNLMDFEAEIVMFPCPSAA